MGKRKIFWAYMMERSQNDHSTDNFSAITEHAAGIGAIRLRMLYMRTDMARSLYELAFLQSSDQDDDVLVMLDQDHVHPENIIERLTNHNVGVAAALAFRRGEPWSPCCYIRDADGYMNAPTEWEPGLHKVDVAGTGAIAIQRWVFAELIKQGFEWPHFRYTYETEMMPSSEIFDENGTLKPKQAVVKEFKMPSEDIWFSTVCEQAQIPVFVDFDLISPHQTVSLIDDRFWKEWLKRHPNPQEYIDLLKNIKPMRASRPY